MGASTQADRRFGRLLPALLAGGVLAAPAAQARPDLKQLTKRSQRSERYVRDWLTHRRGGME
jgi:hypothetical protein